MALNGRDLERIMVGMGAGQSSVDTVTRALRRVGKLPTGGRGIHAPPIGAIETALVIATIAASNPASDAGMRVRSLEHLRAVDAKASLDRTFLEALAAILGSVSLAESISEVRVGSNTNLADIHFKDGRTQRFMSGRIDALGLAMFRKEGVLPGELLKYVARVLGGEMPPPKERFVESAFP